MPSSPTSERAQVGVGTLIVFIAMVLVAAIAAGVLVDSAGVLQGRSAVVGEESSAEVTHRVQVTSTLGDVAWAEPKVADIDVYVTRAPGSGDVDVGNATLHWIGPAGSAQFSVSDSASVAVYSISGSTPVLESDSDVFRVFLSLGSPKIDRKLRPGESATIELVTPTGGTTRVIVRVPNSLDESSQSGPAEIEL